MASALKLIALCLFMNCQVSEFMDREINNDLLKLLDWWSRLIGW